MKVLKLMCFSKETANCEEVPSFHLEYERQYKDELEHTKKLEDINLVFDYNSKVYSNEMIKDDIEERLSCKNNWFLMMISRWGKNIITDERLQLFVDFETLHSIYEQKTETMRMCQEKFYSMKNYTIPEWEFKFGGTHISVGCIDFQQLLMGKLDSRRNEGPLLFYGIDSSLIAIAKCKVLYQMMINRADPRNILQVWFSTGWTDQTHHDFQQSLTDLIGSKQTEAEIVKLLRYWKKYKIGVEAAQKKWSAMYLSQNMDNPFDPCANLRNESDRVDFARYLFTGVIFADETKIKHGNKTMFVIPENLGVSKREDENFFHTFNFNHSDFEYDGTLKKSMDTFMMKKTEEIVQLVGDGKIRMDFRKAKVGLDTKKLLQELKEMNPITIDWSNLSDFFSMEDFLEMSRAASSSETTHYLHIMNWTQCYKGASVIDYQHKLPLIKKAFKEYRRCHKKLLSISSNYRQMWSEKIMFMNYASVVDWSLSNDCSDKYLWYFFAGKDTEFVSNPPYLGHWGFQRSDTNICGKFKFVK